MLDLLLAETRWFTVDEALFIVHQARRRWGLGNQSQRGLLLTTFLFPFSCSTGGGDPVYLGFSSRPDDFFFDVHVGHFGHILALM
jgi:hypothetical protein